MQVDQKLLWTINSEEKKNLISLWLFGIMRRSAEFRGWKQPPHPPQCQQSFASSGSIQQHEGRRHLRCQLASQIKQKVWHLYKSPSPKTNRKGKVHPVFGFHPLNADRDFNHCKHFQPMQIQRNICRQNTKQLCFGLFSIYFFPSGKFFPWKENGKDITHLF